MRNDIKNFLILLPIVLYAFDSHAAKPFDFVLAKRAVELSATVDAYGAYCQKPSALGDSYIKRFTENGVDKNKLAVIKDLQKNTYDQTFNTLKTSGQTCKDVEFMLKRLEIMRALKDAAYELNGVDPTTVKDSIPPVELLAPDKPLEIPPEMLKEQ